MHLRFGITTRFLAAKQLFAVRYIVLFVIAGLCAAAAYGQSGRRPTTPAPVPAPAPSVTADDASPISANISSLVVVGEVFHDYAYFKSTNLDSALKEFVRAMKEEPRAFANVTRAGEATFKGAQEQAMQETTAHVIWLGIVIKDDGISGAWVPYFDFAVLNPKTGKTLLNGRLEPGRQQVVAQGGVMKIPRVTNNNSSALSQMKQGAREITYRLKSTGWLCRVAPC